jgi:D-lactate dehydrogenase
MSNQRKAMVHFFDSRPYAVRIHEEQIAMDSDKRYSGLSWDWITPKLDQASARLITAHHGGKSEGEAQIVSVFVQDDVNADVLEQFKKLGVEMVSIRSTGFDNVDIDAADRLGITVTNVPAYSPESIAEFAVAVLMAINRKLILANMKVHSGNFSLDRLSGHVLKGKTAGVIGTGKIGLAALDILLGLGMKVLCFDKYPNEKALDERRSKFGQDAIRYTSLEEIYRESHVISLHCPLTPETHHLIGGESIAQMRKGVIIINTSRGSLVNASAALQGLKSGTIGGLGLDVLEGEKGFFFRDKTGEAIENDTLALLLAQPNVLVTGHQAFLTEEALETIAHTNCENILKFLDGMVGKKHPNSVNKNF